MNGHPSCSYLGIVNGYVLIDFKDRLRLGTWVRVRIRFKSAGLRIIA